MFIIIIIIKNNWEDIVSNSEVPVNLYDRG